LGILRFFKLLFYSPFGALPRHSSLVNILPGKLTDDIPKKEKPGQSLQKRYRAVPKRSNETQKSKHALAAGLSGKEVALD